MEPLSELDLENRRAAPRLSRELEIRYVQQGGAVRTGRAINISQSGARLMLDEGCECPELTVEFEGKVAVLARQVWQHPLPGGKQVVGVVFEGFHWGQRVALDDYLFALEQRAA